MEDREDAGPSGILGHSDRTVDEKGAPIRPGVNGGMMKRQNPEHKPVNYILVESVDEYAKKIEALGGRVVVPKMEVPGICWWALALDPEGNQFAIMQSRV